jgi:elongation factor P
MALSITDLKKGTIFQYEGTPYRVVSYSQKVMGRGGSIVNVRIKSLIDGRTLDKTFKGNEQLDTADVENKDVQYLYRDNQSYFFMDNQSYEQFNLDKEILGDQAGYLKEGDVVIAQIFNGQVVSVELPKNVPLKVTYTENVVKGDTSSNVMKDATVETGMIIKVPAFIKQDDLIKVDTRTGEYLERVK